MHRSLSLLAAILLGSMAAPGTPFLAGEASECDQGAYTSEFRQSDCTFLSSGRNAYFVLEPGFWLRLEEDGKEGHLEVLISVLNDTRIVDGVRTRVVEEREWLDGDLVEVSRNFFALCEETASLFYFGEEVDDYENGTIVGHGGAWLAGQNGARAGILMPGTFLLGSRYFQEIAPAVALDQGCNTAIGTREVTPAGTFTGCVAVRETSPLEPGKKSLKGYCPGIGLVRDNGAVLTDWSAGR